MRLVAGVFALTLFAPFVRAEDAAPRPAAEATRSRVPLRVVRVMPESHQALLFDRARATHVLAEVGTKLDGYSVDEIDDDEVVLSRDGTQFVLAAPEPRRERASRAAAKAADRAAARPADTAAKPADGAPIDPYTDGEIRSVQAPDADPPASTAPPSAASDPAPGSGEVRVAHAPGAAAPTRAIEPGSDGVRVAQAPMEPEPAAPATTSPTATSPTPTASAPVASAPPPTPAPIVPAAARPAAAAPASEAPLATDSRAPTTDSRAPTTDSRAPATDSRAPITDSRAPSPAAEISSPSPSPSPSARSLNAAMPDRPARGKQAAKTKPPRRTAAGKQTDDALGFADILSGDRAARSPRGPATTAGALPADPYPAPAVAPTPPAPSASRTAASSADAVTLSRVDVDRALADFAKLTAAIHASFSDTGVRVDDVTPASIFDRAGLRAGDTITTIDGTRLRSLDDAANLYARASTARALTVQLVRDGKPTTLHVAIQ